MRRRRSSFRRGRRVRVARRVFGRSRRPRRIGIRL